MAVGSNHRSKKSQWIGTIVVIVFFLAVAIVAYLRSPLATIKSIDVAGNTDIPASYLIHDAGFALGQNLYSISIATTEQRLLTDFPLLKTVTVTRDFFRQSIGIEVTEQPIAGILVAQNGLFEITQNGTVMMQDSQDYGVNRPLLTTDHKVSLSLGTQITDPTLLQVVQQLPLIPQSELSLLSELHVTSSNGIPVIDAFTKDHFSFRMPISGMAKSIRFFLLIHQKLVAHHAQPGFVNLLGANMGVYQPYGTK